MLRGSKQAMKILIPLLLVLAFHTQAEIYKCTSNGRTSFSDTPCGDSAEVVDVSASTEKTGAQFSNEEMDVLGSQMGKERRRDELDRDIARTQKEIDSILDNYNAKKARLERELAEHKNKEQYKNWKNHQYKRDQYYEKKRDLNNQINAAYREYKADREKAYNKLSTLKRERNRIN
jgi:hypothetical protein